MDSLSVCVCLSCSQVGTLVFTLTLEVWMTVNSICRILLSCNFTKNSLSFLTCIVYISLLLTLYIFIARFTWIPILFGRLCKHFKKYSHFGRVQSDLTWCVNIWVEGCHCLHVCWLRHMCNWQKSADSHFLWIQHHKKRQKFKWIKLSKPTNGSNRFIKFIQMIFTRHVPKSRASNGQKTIPKEQ